MARLATLVEEKGWLAGVFAAIRRRPYTFAGFVIAIAVVGPFLTREGDWEGCYLREARHLLAGDTLYGHDDLYPYSPFPALLAVPFAVLPQGPSQVLWYLVNMLCLGLMIRWAWQLAGGGRLEGGAAPIARSEHLIFFLGLLCGGLLAWNCLSHHQTDLLIGAALMGGCLALARARGYLGATCFALAAAMKGTPMLFAPYLLWRGRWKECLWMLTFFVGVNILPTIVVPAQHDRFLFREWAERFLKPMGESKAYPFFWYTESNQSLIGAGYRWFQTTWEWTDQFEQQLPIPNPMSPTTLRGLILVGGVVLLLGTMLAQGWRRTAPDETADRAGRMRLALECSMVLLLMLLFSPMSSKPHFGTLLLPGFCLARLMLEQRSRVLLGLVLAALSAVLLSQNFMGDYIVCVAMWHGTLTWAVLLLLIGSGYALRTCLTATPHFTPQDAPARVGPPAPSIAA